VLTTVITAQRYAIAVCAMALGPSVRPSHPIVLSKLLLISLRNQRGVVAHRSGTDPRTLRTVTITDKLGREIVLKKLDIIRCMTGNLYHLHFI